MTQETARPVVEVFSDLERTLLSRQVKMTQEEAKILLDCKSRAVRDFMFGSLGAFILSWAGCRGQSFPIKLTVTAGVSAAFGLWTLGTSLNSNVVRILSQDGSRIQRELANILVKEYQDNPWIMKQVSKHFYSERVFDDSTSDMPKLRWRYRNSYVDGVFNRSHSQREQESRYHNDSSSGTHNNSQSGNYSDYSDAMKSELRAQNSSDPRASGVNADPRVDATSDPLGIVFGNTESGEEIHHPTASITQSKVTRSYKRSHRRHRKRRQEVSDSEYLQA